MPGARLVLVVGPTAAGKTELALRLAEAAGGEIVSADSQQVYVGMDIGTNKATAAEQARVRHHLVDLVPPDQSMTAARWAGLADDIIARGTPIVVCGGTGLYVRALLYGLFEGPPADPAVRARLEAEPLPALHARLAEVDPRAAARIHATDRVRMVRALEVFELTGVPISTHQDQHDHDKVPLRYQVRGVGLAPPRPRLVERIDARVDQMVAAGLEDEVRRLHAAGYGCELRSFGAIGYREMCAVVEGRLGRHEAIAQIKAATRRYARRQVAWFRSEPWVSWYETASDVDVPGLSAWLREPATTIQDP